MSDGILPKCVACLQWYHCTGSLMLQRGNAVELNGRYCHKHMSNIIYNAFKLIFRKGIYTC
uniref:Uncharacterized protein n=1 Tax=Anguilla anguilla TaxID=7936 RepID=A0A0E9SB97_ANGAN